MNSNVIAFDRNRKPATARAAAAVRSTAAGIRDNVVSLADWKGRARAHRTASGVFFSTGVLVTCGDVA